MFKENTEKKMVLSLDVFDDENNPETFRSRGDDLMVDLKVLMRKHGLYFGGTSSFREVD